MKSTKYLTGEDPERYKDLLLPLARLRIADMRNHQTELRRKAYKLDKNSNKYTEIVDQFDEISKAKEFWQDLLDE